MKTIIDTYNPDEDDLGPRFAVHFGYAERVKTTESWSSGLHFHEGHEWFVIREGTIRCWIDNYEFTVKPGDFYFVQAGQDHNEIALPGAIDFFCVRFHLFDHLGLPVRFFPPQGDPKRQRLHKQGGRFWAFFKDIFREVYQQQPAWRQVVEGVIQQALWHLLRRLDIVPLDSRQQNTSGYQAGLVRRAKQYIELNFHRRIALDELGRLCCVSPYHLNHLFKKFMGMAPVQYSMSLRIEEAKRLLANRELTVYMVAEQSGFRNAEYFSRLFKKVTSLSPGIYRQKLSDA